MQTEKVECQKPIDSNLILTQLKYLLLQTNGYPNHHLHPNSLNPPKYSFSPNHTFISPSVRCSPHDGPPSLSNSSIDYAASISHLGLLGEWWHSPKMFVWGIGSGIKDWVLGCSAIYIQQLLSLYNAVINDSPVSQSLKHIISPNIVSLQQQASQPTDAAGAFHHNLLEIDIPDQFAERRYCVGYCHLKQELCKQITQSLNKAYSYPEFQQFLNSLPIESLLHKSVEYHVGSKSIPRNDWIVKILINIAEYKARKSYKEYYLVNFYRAFYMKLRALEKNDLKQYDHASAKITQLGNKGHPLSNYVYGRELVMLVEKGMGLSWDQNPQVDMISTIFEKSLCNEQYGGLHFIAYIARKRQPDLSPELANIEFEMYCQAASFGHALSLFSLAKMYTIGECSYQKRRDFKLYKKYLVKAAELGVLEAQHNLAMNYIYGHVFPKDEVLGLAWLMKSSYNGFTISKFNLSKLLLYGSQCGVLKPNPKASLVYLEQLKDKGEFNVDKDIMEAKAALEKK